MRIMRNKGLYIFTFLALLLVVYLFLNVEELPVKILSVEVAISEQTERISCWESDTGEFYVVLPGYADFSSARIRLETETSVTINGIPLTDGMCCASFQQNTPYELTYSVWGTTRNKLVTFIQSGGVAGVHIDTKSGNMDYIHQKKGNEEAGKLRLYTADGTLDYAGEFEALNGRGNAAWLNYDKKAYSLKLNNEADLLNMGAAQKWILLANAYDSSNMRNKIVYDFAKDAGLPYSPDSQWVDLYLNGEYSGLYLLCERNEIHVERVNIPDHSSYLVSMELEERLISQAYPYVSTEAAQTFRIHHPRNVGEATRQEVLDIIQSIENALLSKDGIDSVTGKHWLELIDLDSWAKKYLIEEVFGNLDGGMVSQYFYYDQSTGLTYAGPVWDYDHAMGNDSDPAWNIVNPEVLVVNRPFVDSTWYSALCSKEAFSNRLREIYRHTFLPLLAQLLEADLYRYAEDIYQAAAADRIRWNLHDTSQDIASQVEQIRGYLSQHIEFLSNIWLEEEKYIQISFRTDRGNNHYYSVQPTESLSIVPQVDITDDATFLGWYYANTNEPFDPTAPIYEDIEIYAKWGRNVSQKVNQVIKLIPLAVIALIGVCLLTAEIRRSRKGW